MGMYDRVIIPRELLPVTDEQYEEFKNEELQTKDMENLLKTYYIMKDGTLEFDTSDGWEEVPMNQRPYPNATGLKALFGRFRDKNPRREVIPDYHGYINFGSLYGKKGVIDFRAKFTDGKLQGVELIGITQY